MNNLSTIFRQAIKNNKQYKEALLLVQQNSQGTIWLIGGALSRTLIEHIYHIPQPVHDFDFVVEKKNDELIVPKEWTTQNNKYGNPKFVKADMSVDFIPLDTIHSIRRRKLEPTIQNFLTGTPLTIQSMAYDTQTGEIFGDIGKNAFLEKTVAVNNYKQAEYNSGIRGITVQELVEMTAKSIGFKAELTSF